MVPKLEFTEWSAKEAAWQQAVGGVLPGVVPAFGHSPYPEVELWELLNRPPQAAVVDQVEPAVPVAVMGRAWREAVAGEMVKISQNYAGAADRFRECGRKLVAVQSCSHDINHTSRPICDHCRNRGCPICAPYDAKRLLDRFLVPIQGVMKDCARWGNRLRHIVLTTQVHPGDVDARDAYARLSNQVQHTLRDCLYPRQVGETERQRVQRWRQMKRERIGWIQVADFGEDNHHLHFHLAYFGPWINQADLSRVWKAQTGFPVVYITYHGSDEKTLREVLKYVTKFTIDGKAIEPELVARIFHVLFRSERVRAHGLFRGLPEVEDPGSVEKCPECEAGLRCEKLGQFLEETYAYITLLEKNRTMPDFTAEVISVLACACLSSDWQDTALHQWSLIWGKNPPDPADYAVRQTNAPGPP